MSRTDQDGSVKLTVRHGSGESGGRLGSFDEADEEVVIPCGDFAPQSDGVLAIGSSDEVERHVLERCEVGGGVAFVCQSASKRDPLSACKREPPCGVVLGLMPGADFGNAAMAPERRELEAFTA